MIEIDSIKEININPKKENHLIVIDSCINLNKDELALIYEYELNGYKLCNAGDLYEYFDQSLPSELISETQMELFSSYRLQTSYNKFFKRVADIFVSLFLLIILSPLILLVALIIKLTSKGPVFYHQKRIGLYNKEFVMHKFRTMRTDAEKGKAMLTVKGDTRITAIGKIIRPLRIDELPQLINVLKGDMALIGPRPLLVQYLPLYSKEQARRHEVRPGITGWAQCNGRNAISWKKKFELDVWYVDHISFVTDIKVIFITIKKVLFREDISQEGQATMEPFNGNN
jgi:exopolysaccharide biosynthesis polyprenyl glycosylphosphotransferase